MSLKQQNFSHDMWQILARGTSANTTGHQQSNMPSFLNSQNQIFKFPTHRNIMSNETQALLEAKNWNTMGIRLPLLYPLNLNYKILENTIGWKQEPTGSVTTEIDNNFVYLMGSLLKKRRRKMNRQKYKKRRKRDCFKREALKNLRERKVQRKERAAARKEVLLSKMVVNRTISKRQARYLSHKVLPGQVQKDKV